MPEITIEYEIPRKAELAKKFAQEAQYSQDGKQVSVGRFIARKSHQTFLDELNILKPDIGFKCIDTEKQKRGVRSEFFLNAEHHPDYQDKFFSPRTDQLENVVTRLAEKEAELQLTDQDRQDALKVALEAKIIELG